MTRYLFISCFIVSAMWVPCSLADANTKPTAIQFKFAPRPGEVIKQRIVTKSVGTMKLADPMPPIRFVQSGEQELVYKCKKINPDRSAVLDITFNILSSKISTIGVRLEYDAKTFDPDKVEHPINRCMGQFYTAINGSTVTGHFKPNGTLDQFVGIREAADRAINQFKKESGEDKVSVALMDFIEQMSATFDDESMTEQMQGCYRMVPDKTGPVRIGEKWDAQWSMAIQMFDLYCQGSGQYELVGIEKLNGRSCAKIRLKETFRVIPNPDKDHNVESRPSSSSRGLLDQLDFTLISSGGEGVAYWDYEAGVLVKLRGVQRMTMGIKLKKPRGTTTTSAPESSGQKTFEHQTSVAVDLIEGDHLAESNMVAPQTQPNHEK